MEQTRKSKPRVDLTGKKFGRLTPKEYVKGGKWICECECGNIIIVDTRNLNSGHTKSCGCLQKEKASQNTYDMSNYEDDNIKVLSRDGSDEQQIAMWKCLCKNCGNIFSTRGSSIRAGYTKSCGCVHSENEKSIIKILTDNNIEFATQYTFSDLKGLNGRPLRFDFAIFKDKKLSHLIEYQGKQHFIKSEGSWGKEFETLQKHDILKKEYCIKNNIRLICINYDEDYSLKDLL